MSALYDSDKEIRHHGDGQEAGSQRSAEVTEQLVTLGRDQGFVTYDDVLNAQRKRIYAERDLIFNKTDLREDVTEMLRTELGPRVKAGVEDPEGPWKLLAYLEDVQPNLNTPWVSFPSFMYKLALEQLGQPTDEADLTKRILALMK